jgi:hypothetical protein
VEGLAVRPDHSPGPDKLAASGAALVQVLGFVMQWKAGAKSSFADLTRIKLA